jgi:hypothetical protein
MVAGFRGLPPDAAGLGVRPGFLPYWRVADSFRALNFLRLFSSQWMKLLFIPGRDL